MSYQKSNPFAAPADDQFSTILETFDPKGIFELELTRARLERPLHLRVVNAFREQIEKVLRKHVSGPQDTLQPQYTQEIVQIVEQKNLQLAQMPTGNYDVRLLLGHEKIRGSRITLPMRKIKKLPYAVFPRPNNDISVLSSVDTLEMQAIVLPNHWIQEMRTWVGTSILLESGAYYKLLQKCKTERELIDQLTAE